MARKRRRSRGKGFQVIPFQCFIDLGTLGDNTSSKNSTLNNALGEDFFCVSVDALWSIRDLGQDEGPIVVGFAHYDYSDSEMLEGLAAEVTDPDDRIQLERSRRLIRKAGQFSGNFDDEALNDGKFIRTPIRWSIGDGHFLAVFAWNLSGATLADTDGASIEVTGNMYGRWQR